MLALDLSLYFNTLIVLRPTSIGQYQTARYSSNFGKERSFGYPLGAKNPDWIKNPQFVVKVKGLVSGESSSHFPVTLILQQEDARMSDDRVTENNKIQLALAVLRMGSIEQEVTYFDPQKHVHLGKLHNGATYATSLNLSNGKYCIIPLTKKKGEYAHFTLTFLYPYKQKESIEFITRKCTIQTPQQAFKTAAAVPKQHIYNSGAKYLTQNAAQNKTPINFASLTNGSLLNGIHAKWAEALTFPFSFQQAIKPGIVIGSRGADAMIKMSKVRETVKMASQIRGKLEYEGHDIPRITSFFLDVNQESLNKTLLGVDGSFRGQEGQGQGRGLYDFNYYYLGDEAVEALVAELIDNKDLEFLDLRGNNIKDDGVIAICRLIEQSHACYLKVLDLRENQYSQKGKRALSGLKTRMTSFLQILESP